MTYRILKDQVVLTRIAGPGHGGNVLFMQRERRLEGGRPRLVDSQPTLFLDAQDFVDLGSPEEITITIQPGDRRDVGAA